MDWVMIEKPTVACRQLEKAKAKGEGTVFGPEELSDLIAFSQSIQWLESESSSDFERLLKKASKAAEAKRNFELTAVEATTWVEFFGRVHQSRIAAIDKNLRGDPGKMNHLREGWLRLRGEEDIFMKFAVYLAQKASVGEGILLNKSERTYLIDFCYWHEEKGNIAPLIEIKDPLHPRLTAMLKIDNADITVLVRLDSEETSFMDKLMQRLNGYSRPVMVGSDKNQGAKAILIAHHTETLDSQTKSTEVNSEHVSIDTRLGTMVTKYLPDTVTSVLSSKEPLMARWIDPLDQSFKGLESKVGEMEKELKKLMLDNESGYERQLAVVRNISADMEQKSQQKLAKLESELQAKDDLLSKQVANDSKQVASDKKKYEEQLQIEKNLYAKLKREGDDKFAKLESELQDANSKIEKAKTAWYKREEQLNSKLQSSEEKSAAWEDEFNKEVLKSDVLRLDYDATLQEIDELKAERTKITEQEAKYAALESELAVLRSSRTNPQVEKDSIAKAVRNAIADKQAEIEKAKAGSAKLLGELQDKQALLAKQITYSDQCEASMKRKDETIAMLKKKDKSIALLKEKDENIALLKSQLFSTEDSLSKGLRELDEVRMENQKLKDRMHSGRAAILREVDMHFKT